MLGTYFIKKQVEYEKKLVNIRFKENHIYLKEKWPGKEFKIAIPSRQELKFTISRASDIRIRIQIILNVDGNTNFIEILLNSTDEAIIRNYFNIPEISNSLETINVDRLFYAKISIFPLAPLVLFVFSIIFSALGFENWGNILLSLLFSIPVLFFPYIKLDRAHMRLLHNKEKIAIEIMSKNKLDYELIDLNKKITPLEMHAMVLGDNPAEFTKSLVEERLLEEE